MLGKISMLRLQKKQNRIRRDTIEIPELVSMREECRGKGADTQDQIKAEILNKAKENEGEQTRCVGGGEKRSACLKPKQSQSSEYRENRVPRYEERLEHDIAEERGQGVNQDVGRCNRYRRHSEEERYREDFKKDKQVYKRNTLQGDDTNQGENMFVHAKPSN
jgi:hypothetical protein